MSPEDEREVDLAYEFIIGWETVKFMTLLKRLLAHARRRVQLAIAGKGHHE